MMRALLIAALLTASASAQSTQLVDGAGAEVVKGKCLACHGADLIVEQRLSRAAWDREVAKMERWGTQLSATEREQVLTYLATNLSPGAVASHELTANRGEAIYQAACRSCHEEDLTTQQRLTRVGWERTVDKMVRWGAAVAAEQREPLVAYLAARYGPRR